MNSTGIGKGAMRYNSVESIGKMSLSTERPAQQTKLTPSIEVNVLGNCSRVLQVAISAEINCYLKPSRVRGEPVIII